MAARQRKNGGNALNVAGVRRVAIIAVAPARMLDVVGPAEVLLTPTSCAAPNRHMRYEIIAAGENRTVPTQIGVPILAHRTYREVCGPVDTLLVGGGEWRRDKRHPPDFLNWLREQSTKVRRLGSVCTGALVLADAGLLNGRLATTHWNWCNELVQKHPAVKVDADPIYIRDKNIYTSAGVTVVFSWGAQAADHSSVQLSRLKPAKASRSEICLPG
jgi:transcriptional regulator GlxA family with amidase domain